MDYNNVKERLKESASILMSAHGYDGVSVREICKHAGVNSNAISYHFGGKESLFEELINSFTHEVYESPNHLLKADVSIEAEFKLCLHLFFEETLKKMLQHKYLIRMFSKEARCRKENIALKDFHKNIMEFLQRGMDLGIINSKLDPSFITGAFMDRIFVQVVHGDQLSKAHGYDINDANYRKVWVQNNLELFFHGLFIKKD